MVATWVIMPVKPLAAGKTRLAHLLSAAERAALLGGFLQRQLAQLAVQPGVDEVLVVSSDTAVHNLAYQFGAQVLIEPYPQGLNTAIAQASHLACTRGAARMLVLPADLPFVQPADVSMMLHAARGNDPLLAICPDQIYTGTNALLLQAWPPTFRFRYGRESFEAHLREARRHQMAVHIVETPGLMFDLDTEADWHSYQVACRPV